MDINIGGTLHSTATGNVVARANEILDPNSNKKQSQINTETNATLAEHDSAITGLNSQNYVSLTAIDTDSTVEGIFTRLGITPAADTVYRVGKWNGATPGYDAAVYSEYSWSNDAYKLLTVISGVDEVFDISQHNLSGDPLAPTKYADLASALGTNGANVPVGIRKGGMSVKFVQSSDNKYMQYRLMATTFSTIESDWQGVDDEPTFNSKNFIESGGVYNLYNIKSSIANTQNIINGKYIHAGGTIFTGDARSIIFFDISDSTKVLLLIPKTASQYAVAYAYANEDSDNATFVLPSTPLTPDLEDNYVVIIDIDESKRLQFIAVSYTTANGAPSMWEMNDYAFKKELKTYLKETSFNTYNEIEEIQNLTPIYENKYIQYNPSNGSLNLSQSSITNVIKYNIKDCYNINVNIPKTGSSVGLCYIYAEEVNDETVFYNPEQYIFGNAEEKDFIVPNNENHTYILLSYDKNEGLPVVFKEDRFNKLEYATDAIAITRNALSATIIASKRISSNYRLANSSRSNIAYFNIKDKGSIKVFIPKCSNNYSACYAYSDSVISQNDECFFIPETILIGDDSEKSFVALNENNHQYLSITYRPEWGVPIVLVENNIEHLSSKVVSLNNIKERLVGSIAYNKKTDIFDKIRPLKLLFIGNSFGHQTCHALPALFESIGYNVTIGIHYQGGSNLEDEYKGAITETKYTYEKYKGNNWVYREYSSTEIENTLDYSNSSTYQVGDVCKYNLGDGYQVFECKIAITEAEDFNIKHWTPKSIKNTLLEKIEDENWDIVFFMQRGAYAGLLSSYSPFFDLMYEYLYRYISSLGYQVGWFMPWAMSDARISELHENVDGGTTNAEMYANICSATEEFIEDFSNKINLFCPCGTGVENQLNYYQQSELLYDGLHTNNIGYFTSALVIFDVVGKYLYGIGIDDLEYTTDMSISSEEDFEKAKISALNAIENPFEMTVIN